MVRRPIDITIVCKGQWVTAAPAKLLKESYFSDVFGRTHHRMVKVAASRGQSFPKWITATVDDDKQLFHKNPLVVERGIRLELDLDGKHPLPFTAIIYTLFESLKWAGDVELWQLSFHLPRLPFPPTRRHTSTATVTAMNPSGETVEFSLAPTALDVMLPVWLEPEQLNQRVGGDVRFFPIEERKTSIIDNPLLHPQHVSAQCAWTPYSLGQACSALTDTLLESKYRGGMRLYIER